MDKDIQQVRRTFGGVILAGGIIFCFLPPTRTISFMLIGFGIGLISGSFQ